MKISTIKLTNRISTTVIFYTLAVHLSRKRSEMFTFGIFTTHLPYIAFVVFYAWFLLFGVGKAVSGEIETGEKYCKTEWVSEKHYNSYDLNSNNFRDTNPGDFKNAIFEELYFMRKLIYPEFMLPVHLSDYYCSSLICRPPPSFV